MGLRCLLGHDFDEPELRREREEDGDEVITTVTEVKTCARCGETQVVSENTEVTTMAQLADEAAAGAEAAETAPSATDPDVSGDGAAADEGGTGVGAPVDPPADPEPGPADSGADATADADVDDAVILDDDPTAPGDDRSEAGVDAGSADDGSAVDVGGDESGDDGAEVLGSEPGDEAGSLGGGGEYAEYPEAESAASPADDEPDAETDDGVILDEEAEPAADRERGAWPDVDEADDAGAGAATTPWPDQRGEDEGFSAEVGEGGSGDVGFGGGLTPETAEPSAGDEDAEYVEAPERDADDVDGTAEPREAEAEPADTGSGITRAESPDLQTSASDAATEYHCPECGMSREAGGSAMRAGDICPECKRGYVSERQV